MSKRRPTVLAVLALCAVLGGCTVADINTGAAIAGSSATYTSHRFLWGLTELDVDLGFTPARVRVYRAFSDWLVQQLTLGIYTPYSVEAWPAAQGAPAAVVVTTTRQLQY